MEYNQQQQEAARKAVENLRELAKGIMPVVSNLNKAVIDLQPHLSPEQKAEFDKFGIGQKTEAVNKRLTELQNEIFNTRK